MIPSRFRPNHYQTLGVGFRASSNDIKNSYHELAKKYHPDQNPDDSQAEARFRQIKEAYECLSSKLRRAEYDQEFIRSGKTRWMAEQRARETEEPEDSSGILSRRDLLIFAALIIGIPVSSFAFRLRKQETPEVVTPSGASWARPVDIPIPTSTDVLVRAYYNPLTKRWEKVNQDNDPPCPLSLFQYAVREHRGLFQSFSRNGGSMPSKDERFEVHMIPERLVAEPLWKYDH